MKSHFFKFRGYVSSEVNRGGQNFVRISRQMLFGTCRYMCFLEENVPQSYSAMMDYVGGVVVVRFSVRTRCPVFKKDDGEYIHVGPHVDFNLIEIEKIVS